MDVCFLLKLPETVLIVSFCFGKQTATIVFQLGGCMPHVTDFIVSVELPYSNRYYGEYDSIMGRN